MEEENEVIDLGEYIKFANDHILLELLGPKCIGMIFKEVNMADVASDNKTRSLDYPEFVSCTKRCVEEVMGLPSKTGETFSRKQLNEVADLQALIGVSQSARQFEKPPPLTPAQERLKYEKRLITSLPDGKPPTRNFMMSSTSKSRKGATAEIQSAEMPTPRTPMPPGSFPRPPPGTAPAGMTRRSVKGAGVDPFCSPQGAGRGPGMLHFGGSYTARCA